MVREMYGGACTFHGSVAKVDNNIIITKRALQQLVT